MMICPKCQKQMVHLENETRSIWVCYKDAEIVWGKYTRLTIKLGEKMEAKKE